MELDVDVATASIDQLIERRSASQEEANRTEELWKAFERRVRERRRREKALAWHDYYASMACVHHGLAAEHAKRADGVLKRAGGGGGGR